MRLVAMGVSVLVMLGCEPAFQPDAGSGGGTANGGGSAAGGGGFIGGGGGSIGGGGGSIGGGGGSIGGGGGSTGGGGGSTGGGGGGGTSASAPSCTTATSCEARDAGTTRCSPAQSTSCIDGLCLPECSSPRTCTVNPDAGCITCGATTTCSTLNGCIHGLSMTTGHIASGTCSDWPDGGAFIGTAVIISPASASQCSSTLSVVGGGLLGRFTLVDDFSYVTVMPTLGGSCTVMPGPVAANSLNWVIACPRCTFMLTTP